MGCLGSVKDEAKTWKYIYTRFPKVLVKALNLRLRVFSQYNNPLLI